MMSAMIAEVAAVAVIGGLITGIYICVLFTLPDSWRGR